MAKLLNTRKKKGSAPGTIVHTGKKRQHKVSIELIDYSSNKYKQITLKDIKQAFPYKNKSTVTWININGVHQTDIISDLGKHYGIHPLVLEDIANINQRPKLEDFDKYVFLVIKMLYLDEKTSDIAIEQISIIMGKNFIVSFQEKEGDVFDHIRERIKNKKGKITKLGQDYLLHALLDAIIDNYFVLLEKIGERIEDLEDSLVDNPSPKILGDIHGLKRSLIYIRKSVWPLREVVNSLYRVESKLINKKTGVYFRDLYDHTIQVIDSVETFRDMASGMVDLYMSSVSNRMNEIMKVLTIFAAIFIPLTFIVGIYGMNFHFMPELKWRYGYFFAWMIIIGTSITMLAFFKRRKWI